jgi:phage baseplate assembly protein gpV
MSTPALSLPLLNVEVNERVLTDAERASLGGIRIRQKLSRPAQCELTFFNEPGAKLTSSFIPGAGLRVAVGAHLPPLFAGEISAIEYVYEPAQGRRVRVRGYDRLRRLSKRQPVRSHVQMGLADFARELAESVGLSLAAPPANLTWRRLIQHGQTDLDFLIQITEACGLYFTLREQVLHLLTLEGLGEAIHLTLGETLLEACVEINSDPACSAVIASGWDPLRAEGHEGRASQARTSRAAGARMPAAWVGNAPEYRFVHQMAQNDAHAEGQAQAELDLRVAREVVLRGVAEGDPRLQPGARVEVHGLAAVGTGRYVLTEVTHIFDERQRFVSEISTYPAGPAPRVQGTSVILGKVTSVDDPDHLGRVQVALPACNGVETDWMGVVTVGAGAGKGLMMLPDVGDTVLVLCAQEDPTQGVVLGGLYGVGGPPDGGIESSSVKRFTCLTPGGQRLRFDDTHKSIRVENAGGSFVELGPDKVAFHGAVDLVIEAPGKTITLRGNAINFEQV